MAAAVIELFGCPDESQVALLDQVQKAQTLVLKFFGDGHYQAQVGGHQLIFGLFLEFLGLLQAMVQVE